MKLTRGIYLLDVDNMLLIAHSTNSSIWSIPKGRPEIGEDFHQTAYREYFEETNINLIEYNYVCSGMLPNVIYKSKKKELESMFIKIDTKIDIKDIVCTSMTECENPYPENDKFLWVTLDDAVNYIIESQITNLEIIKNKIL